MSTTILCTRSPQAPSFMLGHFSIQCLYLLNKNVEVFASGWEITLKYNVLVKHRAEVLLARAYNSNRHWHRVRFCEQSITLFLVSLSNSNGKQSRIWRQTSKTKPHSSTLSYSCRLFPSCCDFPLCTGIWFGTISCKWNGKQSSIGGTHCKINI